jgi:UDP-N-acetylmuramate--alanine ligase
MKYYLSGVAGTGMNALAQYLKAAGHSVYGSDRSFDNDENEDYKSFLAKKGIHLVKQDGRVLDKTFDTCIFSAAVEKSVPDFRRARELNLAIKTRSLFLKEIYNRKKSIGIAGTSGKTTVTGMLATILIENKLDTSFVCGAEILNYSDNGMGGNCLFSDTACFLAEVDESDKVIDRYRSQLALITNISEDHMTLSEAVLLFQHFIMKAKKIIYNMDCIKTREISEQFSRIKIGFSLANPNSDIYVEDIRTENDHCTFTIQSVPFKIAVPGRYNIENAAAAVAAATAMGVDLKQCAWALTRFSGIKGRFERIKKNIYYDFAHNPAKIDSLLSTAIALYASIIIYYQPHGYAPFKNQLDALSAIFHKHLRSCDLLVIGSIYDAGGSVSRDISSVELVDALKKESFPVCYGSDRNQIAAIIIENLNKKAACFIVGARDRSLRRFAFTLGETI